MATSKYIYIYIYQSKTPKMIKLYIYKNRKMEITFKIFLIFREKKLSIIKFREKKLHYTTSQNNYIFFTQRVGL